MIVICGEVLVFLYEMMLGGVPVVDGAGWNTEYAGLNIRYRVRKFRHMR